MEKAIAYIRVSTDRQVTDGTSLLSQRKRVEQYVASKSYGLDRLFVEEGESAKTDSRPELQKMLTYCKQNRGRIQVLIFPKVDRFARYSEDYHYLKRYLRNLGIRVESTDERFDDTPAGRFLESMLAAQAQFDNDVRSERSRGGMKEAASQGRWVCGKPPIGYRHTRSQGQATIEPDPVKGPIITEAFQLLASGRHRPESVRHWLADHGLALCRSRFYEILRDRTYLAIITSFGLNQQAAPPFVPLVSERIFCRVQDALQVRRAAKTNQRDHPDFPLRGTLRCSCGRLLTACWARGRSRSYPYYRCMRCQRINLRREWAHRQFVRLLGIVKKRYRITETVRQELIAAWKEDRAGDEEHRTRLTQEVSKLRDLQRAISLKNAQGIIPDDLAREHLDETSGKLIRLQGDLDEIDTPQEQIDEVIDFAQGFIEELGTRWTYADLESKKHVQAFFFPQGASIQLETAIRTARADRPTGLGGGSDGNLSAVVGHGNATPNPVARTKRSKLALPDLLKSLQAIYTQFGSESPSAFESSPSCSKRG
jgi:site-specific DNA recombinase